MPDTDYRFCKPEVTGSIPLRCNEHPRCHAAWREQAGFPN
jgi:hypothetical protein